MGSWRAIPLAPGLLTVYSGVWPHRGGTQSKGPFCLFPRGICNLERNHASSREMRAKQHMATSTCVYLCLCIHVSACLPAWMSVCVCFSVHLRLVFYMAASTAFLPPFLHLGQLRAMRQGGVVGGALVQATVTCSAL